MKRTLLLCCLLPIACALCAAPIDSLTARRIACRALLQYADAASLEARRAPAVGSDSAGRTLIDPVEEAHRLSLRRATASTYLFASPRGAFVLTAADSRLPAVIAYGFGATGQEMPPPVRAFCATMEQVQQAPLLPEGNFTPVAPLLGDMVRHQEAPFNGYCPYYTDAEGRPSEQRCVVGCVATALEEILTHHGRTITLQDTLHGWTTDHYAIPDILPGTSVDTRLILPRYDAGQYSPEAADAVARLSYYCGVAARMNWGLSESGANIRRLIDPLERAFGYGFVHYADSYRYAPEDWTAMLCGELAAGRPVLYAAYTMLIQGHAFVVDGLDADGFFHVNWGYGGHYDGYFRLDLLNFAEPKYDFTEEGGAAGGFFCNHEALLLYPDSVDVALPDTLSRTGREFVVEELRPLSPAETGKYTPLRLTVRNAGNRRLTTPFEVFTNAPTDTALFEQADYVALAGCTLEPGERKTFELAARFSERGTRHLRLSPDDVLILADTLIDIAGGVPSDLTYEVPLIDFPDATTARVTETIHNAAGAGRAGRNVVYELLEGPYTDEAEGTRHTVRLYLPGGESHCDTILFRGLRPGATYTLLVRNQWPIVHRLTFVQGADPAGISRPTVPASPAEAARFTIEGKPLPPGRDYRGVVVGRGKKVLHR